MQVVLGKNPQTAVYGYAIAVGMGSDPNILGDTFYSYYTAWPKGISWQAATLSRLTLTTAATTKTIVPPEATAGSSGFTLAVTGDHFVKTSTAVGWLPPGNDLCQRGRVDRADPGFGCRNSGRGRR